MDRTEERTINKPVDISAGQVDTKVIASWKVGDLREEGTGPGRRVLGFDLGVLGIEWEKTYGGSNALKASTAPKRIVVRDKTILLRTRMG